jgi:argininosuccinate lyase
VGTLVGKALKQGVALAELPLDEFRAAHPQLDESVYEVLGAGNAVRAMQSYGSTAPQQVDGQIARWKERLDMEVPAEQSP